MDFKAKIKNFFQILHPPTSPTEHVLHFFADSNTAMETNTSAVQAFTCRTSTFLVLPVFQFAFHYSDGTVRELPLDLTLTEVSLNGSFGRISNIWKAGGEAQRTLELWEFHDVTNVSCMVRLTNSTNWINWTLPVSHLGKKGNGLNSRVSSSTSAAFDQSFRRLNLGNSFKRFLPVTDLDLCHSCWNFCPINCFWTVYTSVENEAT